MFRIPIILSLALGIGASCMAQNRLVLRGDTNQVRQADATHFCRVPGPFWLTPGNKEEFL
jgi:hypothetical protein